MKLRKQYTQCNSSIITDGRLKHAGQNVFSFDRANIAKSFKLIMLYVANGQLLCSLN